MDNPSVSEANKLLRVLNGDKLKYTIRINLPDSHVIEFQRNEKPALEFFEADRCLWLMDKSGYGAQPIMKWIDGSIMLCEENPK